jgi:hypothetical protein
MTEPRIAERSSGPGYQWTLDERAGRSSAQAAAPRQAHANAAAALMAAGFGATLSALIGERLDDRRGGRMGDRRRTGDRVAGRIPPDVLITVGYAAAAKTGVPAELWTLLTGYPGMITATAALMLLVVAGVTSVRVARRAMRHETWWIVHLYASLALALAFRHQIATGRSFVGHPVAQTFWIALWAATAGVVLVYRVGLPLVRSLRHRLVVVGIHRESPDTYSIVLRGRNIHRLAVSGGQFLSVAISAARPLLASAPLLVVRPAGAAVSSSDELASRPSVRFPSSSQSSLSDRSSYHAAHHPAL